MVQMMSEIRADRNSLTVVYSKPGFACELKQGYLRS